MNKTACFNVIRTCRMELSDWHKTLIVAENLVSTVKIRIFFIWASLTIHHKIKVNLYVLSYLLINFLMERKVTDLSELFIEERTVIMK